MASVCVNALVSYYGETMSKDIIVETITKVYFGCKVTAYKTKNTMRYYPSFPWRFKVEHNGSTHEYWGIPNYVETRAMALKRGWYRAKWLHDETYANYYSQAC